MNPFIFLKENMTMQLPLKVISDALEMVEAGVTDRFVTSYEKTREQIRF